MDKTAILNLISNAKGATFASFTYTATSGRVKPEKARYTVGLNFDTKRIYEEDLKALEALEKTLLDVELQACKELIASLKESLSKGVGNNSRFTRKESIHQTPIKGIRLVEQKDGSTNWEILCNVLQKKVLEKGEYKKVNSSQKTIAKNAIRSKLQISKIRSFTLKGDEMKIVKMKGETLQFE